MSEKCPTCSAPVIRTKGYDNGLIGASKIASADTFTYAGLSSPVPAPEDMADAIIQRVCELEYTPPEDFPEDMVMCTTAELRLIVSDEVSRLRSQVERLKAAIGLIVQLANTDHEQFCGAWNNYPEDCNCSYKAANDALRRLSSDSETGGENG